MKALAEQIAELDGPEIYGRVAGIRGLMVEVAGPVHAMPVSARVVIETDQARNVPCEVVGFAGDNALLMPFAPSKACGAAAGRSFRPPWRRCGRRRAGSAGS
jgi:flagellum-specific ATP synthase